MAIHKATWFISISFVRASYARVIRFNSFTMLASKKTSYKLRWKAIPSIWPPMSECSPTVYRSKDSLTFLIRLISRRPPSIRPMCGVSG